MKTKFSYLDFHYDCMETGLIPYYGLCNCIPSFHTDLLYYFQPDDEELDQIIKEKLSAVYWASCLGWDDDQILNAYTPLRQTIVLFCAAMNNEL